MGHGAAGCHRCGYTPTFSAIAVASISLHSFFEKLEKHDKSQPLWEDLQHHISADINYGILLVWFLFFAIAHDWIQRLHGRWFRLSSDQFDAFHYAGMSIFKIGIILFNLVPLVVLWIVG